VFGVVSFLVNVAATISSVAKDSDQLDGAPDGDADDLDEVMSFNPLVDVLEEEDELVVLIERFGFYSESVKFKTDADILVLLDAEDRDRHEILLPDGYDLEEPTHVHSNNGVMTIRYRKTCDTPCLRSSEVGNSL